MPIIPAVTNAEGNPFADPHEVRLDRTIRLLKKYGHLLADDVLCAHADGSWIAEFQQSSDRRVIPLVSDVRVGQSRHAFLNWVIEHRDNFSSVMVGNVSCELSDCWSDVNTMTVEGLRLVRHLPELQGKHLFGPVDTGVRRDIVPYISDLDIAPLRHFLLKYSPRIVIFNGLTNFTHDEGFAAWCTDLEVFIGMNYHQGAMNHHLQKYVNFGLSGAVFFLPIHEEDVRADWLMEQYTCDIS